MRFTRSEKLDPFKLKAVFCIFSAAVRSDRRLSEDITVVVEVELLVTGLWSHGVTSL